MEVERASFMLPETTSTTIHLFPATTGKCSELIKEGIKHGKATEYPDSLGR